MAKKDDDEKKFLLLNLKEKFPGKKPMEKTLLKNGLKENLYEFFHESSVKKYVFVSLSIILIFILLTASLMLVLKKNPEKISREIPKCGDGTLYGTCSLKKPYYCSSGILEERATLCGCPDNLAKKDEFCPSQYEKNQRDIKLNYILKGEEKEINFTIYDGVAEYVSEIPEIISYSNGEIASRTDFKLKNINEKIQRQSLVPLVVKIQNLAETEEDQIRIAVSIVQNIEWGGSDKTFKFQGFEINHSRYLYEVLNDSRGLCGEKSELLAFLLKEMGYGTAIFYNQEENHESLGIKCPLEKSWYSSGYCFIETSGPSVITDTSIAYIGGLKLQSEPEILVISDGKSLRENLYEYKDAKDLMDIRAGNFRGILKLWKLNGLEKKYGLLKKYNLG